MQRSASLRAFAPLLMALASSALPGSFERVAEAADPTSVSAQAAIASTPNDLDRLVGRLDEDERNLRSELAESGPALEVTRKRMVARSRAYFREMRAGFLPAGAGFDALVDHAARVERLRRAVERDVAAEASLLKRNTELETQLIKVRAERAPLDVQREAMNRARLALAEQEERRAAFGRAFETSVRPDGSVAIYGAETGPSEGDARTGFRSMKGRLPFPIAGRAEVRRIHRDGAGPSMELVAGPGAAVRTVAAGHVAFADRYEDYGLTVIVDHGDRYFTVYANLASIDVHAGDAISAGARLGAVGTERGAMLHLELRHGSAAVDPGPWLGI